MPTPRSTRPHAFAATLKSFTTACGKVCRCYSLLTLAGQFPNVRCLPVSMRIALEAELQHLHWQFWRPEARPQCGHQPKRPGLRGDAAGQPQLRAAHSAQSQGQFFGQPAAGGGLCDFRHGAARPEHRTGGQGSAGKDVCLADTWPSSDEIHALMKFDMNGLAYQQHYARIATEPGERWERIKGVAGTTDSWPKSTYIADPPFLTTFTIKNEASDAIDTRAAGLKCPESVRNARIMALLGDSISTDHVSPAGAIKESSPAGQWALAHGVQKADFNSYGARLGDHALLHFDTPIEVDYHRAGGILPFVLPQRRQDDRV